MGAMADRSMEMGPMNMGPMILPAMASVCGGQADTPGAPVFGGLGARTHPIRTTNRRT
jgi:hypothetical protein